MNNRQLLWNLLANPADTGQIHTHTLEQLVNDHPQSGVLQVLLARSGGSRDVKKAAVYFKAGTLHKLMHHPDILPAVSPAQIIEREHPYTQKSVYSPEHNDVENTPAIDNGENTIGAETTDIAEEAEPETVAHFEEADDEQPEANEIERAVAIEQEEDETLLAETQPEAEDNDNIIPELYHSYTEQIADPHATEALVSAAGPNEEETIIPEPYDTFEEQPADIHTEEPEPANKPETLINLNSGNGHREEKEYFRQDIDDEIYDEIVGIDDIGFEPVINVLHEATIPEAEPGQLQEPISSDRYDDLANADSHPVADEEGHPEETPGVIHDDKQKLVKGNTVSADYLSFDKKLDELRIADMQEPPAMQNSDASKDTNEVSRYNDDSLPYSFMWWLDKTRKEHADNLQPYAEPVVRGSNSTVTGQNFVKPVKRVAPDELQQQYYENIFSLTSVSSIDKADEAPTVAFDHNKKEDIIIERFITAEPQIKPPAANKLDNENKAKKSAEDHDALVTETLARIYTDQMLYHKAIATYKKLVLKFPEKKLYFASQIEQLEKKTN